jgi:hypothetical protein
MTLEEIMVHEWVTEGGTLPLSASDTLYDTAGGLRFMV